MAEDKKPTAEEAQKNEGEGTEEGAAPKKSKKKLIMIAAIAVIVLAAGGGGAFFFLKGGKKEEAKTSDPNLIEKTAYFDLDEFLVNLNNPGSQVSFLKTIITLEVPNQATLTEVQSKMPRIRDAFQVYLRELRNSDLQGSAGLQRLRSELLLRINEILEDTKVTDILFKEIIVQ
jgi:flagellar FliL protein